MLTFYVLVNQVGLTQIPTSNSSKNTKGTLLYDQHTYGVMKHLNLLGLDESKYCIGSYFSVGFENLGIMP